MNISKRKVYVVPEVRIVKVCQENLMQEFTSWNDGTDTKPIIEGNPAEGSDPYAAKWHGFNAWDDDIKY